MKGDRRVEEVDEEFEQMRIVNFASHWVAESEVRRQRLGAIDWKTAAEASQVIIGCLAIPKGYEMFHN